MNLIKNSKITVLYAGSTLAATDVDSTVLVDMSQYESVLLVGSAYKTTAGGTTGTYQLVPRHSAVNTSTTGITDLGSTAAVADTSFSTGDGGKIFAVDIKRPTKRYITASINRTGANKVGLGTLFAIQYNPHKSPVTQTSTATAKLLISPTT